MSPRRAIPQHNKQGISPLLVIIVGIVIVLVLLGVDLLSKIQPPTTSTSTLSASSRTAGDAQATVALTEFGDFQ